MKEPSDKDSSKSPLPRYGGGSGRGPVEIRTRAGTLKKAKSLRKNMTDAERRIWFLLRRHQMQGYNFRRQVPIGPYIVDFACLSLKLIIELDGGQHADRMAQDEQRSEFLRARGFRVLRFWNNDVLGNTDGVLEMIMRATDSAARRRDLPSP